MTDRLATLPTGTLDRVRTADADTLRQMVRLAPVEQQAVWWTALAAHATQMDAALVRECLLVPEAVAALVDNPAVRARHRATVVTHLFRLQQDAAAARDADGLVRTSAALDRLLGSLEAEDVRAVFRSLVIGDGAVALLFLDRLPTAAGHLHRGDLAVLLRDNRLAVRVRAQALLHHADDPPPGVGRADPPPTP